MLERLGEQAYRELAADYERYRRLLGQLSGSDGPQGDQRVHRDKRAGIYNPSHRDAWASRRWERDIARGRTLSTDRRRRFLQDRIFTCRRS